MNNQEELKEWINARQKGLELLGLAKAEPVKMNSQEELVRIWRQQLDNGMFGNFPGFLLIAKMDDPGHSHEVSQTMIYTGDQAEGLATQAVEKAEEAAKAEDKPPLSEEEKDRLWKAVLESCSG